MGQTEPFVSKGSAGSTGSSRVCRFVVLGLLFCIGLLGYQLWITMVQRNYFEQHLSKLRLDYRKLRLEKEAVDKKVEENAKTINQGVGMLAVQKKAVDDFKQQIDNLQKQMSQSDAKISELTGQLSESKKTLQEKIDYVNKREEEFKGELDRLQGLLTQCQQRMRDTTEELVKAKQQIGDMKSQQHNNQGGNVLPPAPRQPPQSGSVRDEAVLPPGGNLPQQAGQQNLSVSQNSTGLKISTQKLTEQSTATPSVLNRLSSFMETKPASAGNDSTGKEAGEQTKVAGVELQNKSQTDDKAGSEKEEGQAGRSDQQQDKPGAGEQQDKPGAGEQQDKPGAIEQQSKPGAEEPLKPAADNDQKEEGGGSVSGAMGVQRVAGQQVSADGSPPGHPEDNQVKAPPAAGSAGQTQPDKKPEEKSDGDTKTGEKNESSGLKFKGPGEGNKSEPDGDN